MSFSVPVCPSCGESLVLTNEGQLDTWVCPTGHGLGATLSEAFEHAQEDELALLWQLTRQATPTSSARRCPMCAAPMVCVEVPFDPDEALDGEPGDLDPTGNVWLDVCELDQLIWFDSGELNAFPADLADPEPSTAELDGAARIRAAFGQSIVESSRARESRQITERIYQRISRHRGLTRVLTEVGSLGRR